MHDHLAMQNINGSQQLFHEVAGLVNRECPVPAVKLICQHLIAEFKDAVDVLGLALVILKDVKKAYELLVIDKLPQEGDFAHR